MLIEEKIFDKCDYSKTPFDKGEYEYCTFRNCNFSKSDLSTVRFMECKFEDCDFSMADITGTIFQDIIFKDCKMLGLSFENSESSGPDLGFENCNLSHSSFVKMKMKKSHFRNVKFHETDFTECDLSASVFENCDLTRARFIRTRLEKTDFRTAVNYDIDPEINRISGAKFSVGGIAGLLGRYNIEIDF